MNTYQNISYTGSLNRAIAKTFIWMMAGLLVTTMTSFAMLSTGLWYVLLSGMSPFILMIVQLGLVIWFSAAMRHSSPAKLKVLFMAYAVTLGISLTPISFMYSSGLIFVAFFITAFYFACLAIVGLTTKKDLTKIGNLCMVALVVMLITQLVLMLFRFDFSTRLMSALGLLIFTGITAWDMQRMKAGISQTEGIMQDKFIIFMAFEIYLDFINIFLYVLRLLGIGSNND